MNQAVVIEEVDVAHRAVFIGGLHDNRNFFTDRHGIHILTRKCNRWRHRFNRRIAFKHNVIENHVVRCRGIRLEHDNVIARLERNLRLDRLEIRFVAGSLEIQGFHLRSVHVKVNRLDICTAVGIARGERVGPGLCCVNRIADARVVLCAKIQVAHRLVIADCASRSIFDIPADIFEVEILGFILARALVNSGDRRSRHLAGHKICLAVRILARARHFNFNRTVMLDIERIHAIVPGIRNLARRMVSAILVSECGLCRASVNFVCIGHQTRIILIVVISDIEF